MVPINTFQRVPTRILLPIAAVYLLLVGLDVNQGIRELSVEKPTLLSRTPPFQPLEQFLFKREATNNDEKNDEEDDKDSKTSTPAPSSRSSQLQDDTEDVTGRPNRQEDSKNKSKDDESDTSKTDEAKDSEGTASNSTEKTDEGDSNDIKAGEGSRHSELNPGSGNPPNLNLLDWWKLKPPTDKDPSNQAKTSSKPKPTSAPDSTVAPTTSMKSGMQSTSTDRPKSLGSTSDVDRISSNASSSTTSPSTSPTSNSTPTPKPGSAAKRAYHRPGWNPAALYAQEPLGKSHAGSKKSTTIKPIPSGAPTAANKTNHVPESAQRASQRPGFPFLSMSTKSPSPLVSTATPDPKMSTTSPKSDKPEITHSPASPSRGPASTGHVPKSTQASSSNPKVPSKISSQEPNKSSTGRPQVTTNQTTTKLPTPKPPARETPNSKSTTTTSKPMRSLAPSTSAAPSTAKSTTKPLPTAPRPNGSVTKKPSNSGTITPRPTQPTVASPTNPIAKSTTQPQSNKSTSKSPNKALSPATMEKKPSTSIPHSGPGVVSLEPSDSSAAKTTTALPSGGPSAASTKPSEQVTPAHVTDIPRLLSEPVQNLTGPSQPVAYAHPVSIFAKPPNHGTANAVTEKPIQIPVNPNITRDLANPDAELLLGFNRTIFDPRDLTYFLESHPAHSIHDPRVYFTSERTTRSLALMSREIQKVPERLRFAYLVRVFNELGRKIASKLNHYAVELVAVLKKSPDELGNKPEVSMLVDAVNNAFESKDDREINGPPEIELEYDKFMTRVIESNSEKTRIFRAAMSEISNRFAQLISYFVHKATTPPKGSSQAPIKMPSTNLKDKFSLLLGESLKSGAKTFILETAYDDRFRIPLDAVGYTNLILNDTINSLTERIKRNDMNVSESIRREFDASMNVNSFKDLNALSDQIGLIGSWNSFLFSNLGTAERLIKVYASLLSRVPPEVKARWINMYISQVHTEMERTISGFVLMQSMPYHANASEKFLLDPAKTVELMPNKVPTIRDNYLADKNRVPARCYLAGRRWRLLLARGLNKYADKEFVLDNFANRVGAIKNRLMDESGNDIFRLCLPRLEVGIRGWSIDGNPEGPDTDKSSDKFPLKNPIEGLTEMKDPFASGAVLGFGIGFRVGYNEERNATLEMEQASHLQIGSNEFNSSLGLSEVNYVAMASYRKAATVGARKAFELSIREGYMTSLKISVRAGMNIPVETGSRISALKSVSFAGQAGAEAGKLAAEGFILGRKLTDDMKKKLLKVGETHGLLAGEIAGESIGSIVGKAAAEEAFRRSIIRGGKVARAKFHLEEFEAGAKLGFEYGIKEGKSVASSSTLDPSAPRYFRLPKPVFSDQDKPDNEVDRFEKELIPPLTDSIIETLGSARDHTPVRGSLKGTYKVAKEIKKGFQRVSFFNVTYDLEVFAQGYIKDNIAYLSLNGTVNKKGFLRGSLIARDIFNDDQDE